MPTAVVRPPLTQIDPRSYRASGFQADDVERSSRLKSLAIGVEVYNLATPQQSRGDERILQG